MTRELANQLTGVRGAETWNLYGPTETTIWSTAHKLRAAYQETPPIGRALSNTQVYVLNGDLRPVEPGAEGELYLGGAGLARGYIARPDLTAERFVPSPFAAADGERLYRTGDLVRISPDGELEFTGRKDNQVKVRGHRIEPGEIEAELRGMAGIADAAVICRADNSGNNSLVAYVVAARNVPVSASALRAGLQTRLPDYMIPSGFVELRELPLTPNGKTDRRALAALGEGGGVQYHAPYSAPATPTERTIAELWASVLDLDYVGVNDDFFELGGHSLLAVEVLLRLEEATRRRISLQQFFENPILNTLAELIDSLPPLAEEREPYELEL